MSATWRDRDRDRGPRIRRRPDEHRVPRTTAQWLHATADDEEDE